MKVLLKRFHLNGNTILFTDQRDDAEASGEKIKRRGRNEVCAACTDLTEIFNLTGIIKASVLTRCVSGQKFNFFFSIAENLLSKL